MFQGCGICPVCRRVAPADHPCGLDGAIVRSIVSTDDKQALIDAVWGASAARVELARRGAARRASPAVRLSTGAITGMVTVFAFQLGAASTSFSVLAGATAATFAALTTRATRGRTLVPSGGAALTSQPRYAAGRILRCPSVLAPGSGHECAAWAIELRYDGRWGSRITLRVGGSAGFEVALDDGEHVRIPAGPLWLEGRLPQLADLESPAFEELLRTLDPTRATAEDWPVFQFNIISEQCLRVGDRVEVLGRVERELVGGERDGTYRDAPASVLVARGVPTLRPFSIR